MGKAGEPSKKNKFLVWGKEDFFITPVINIEAIPWALQTALNKRGRNYTNHYLYENPNDNRSKILVLWDTSASGPSYIIYPLDIINISFTD